MLRLLTALALVSAPSAAFYLPRDINSPFRVAVVESKPEWGRNRASWRRRSRDASSFTLHEDDAAAATPAASISAATAVSAQPRPTTSHYSRRERRKWRDRPSVAGVGSASRSDPYAHSVHTLTPAPDVGAATQEPHAATSGSRSTPGGQKPRYSRVRGRWRQAGGGVRDEIAQPQEEEQPAATSSIDGGSGTPASTVDTGDGGSRHERHYSSARRRRRQVVRASTGEAFAIDSWAVVPRAPAPKHTQEGSTQITKAAAEVALLGGHDNVLPSAPSRRTYGPGRNREGRQQQQQQQQVPTRRPETEVLQQRPKRRYGPGSASRRNWPLRMDRSRETLLPSSATSGATANNRDVGESSTRSSLKTELLNAIRVFDAIQERDGKVSVDFGVKGGELDKDTRAPRNLKDGWYGISRDLGEAGDSVLALAEKLGSSNPTEEPTKFFGTPDGGKCPLHGTWKLKFTTAADASFSKNSSR